MEKIEGPRVLVLDADMVPALTISRSLARRGCIVEIASHTSKPLTGYSNAVSSTYQYPNPLLHTSEFVEWLSQHGRREHYDLIMPVTERTLVPLSRHRERLQHLKIAMPNANSLEVALDKSQTLKLAEQVGVPSPVGVSLSSMDDLAAVLSTVNYPVVLKPSRSLGSADGETSQLQVSYAFDEVELQAGCAHAFRFGAVVLQEFFAGSGVGIELIAHRGKVVYAFQHLRLHEVPLTGGGSSLRKSQAVMPQLLDASERLMAALDWNGVAMVEFKLDTASGEFSLMEINGRFWGSLPLSVVAGADFPSMLLDLELNGEIEACAEYRNDIYCRLVSRDLHWYEAFLRGGTDTRIANIPLGWDVFKELRLFFSLRHRYDVQSLTDPVPGLVDLGRILRSYGQRLASLLEERLFYTRQRRAWRRGEVSAAISNADSLLFICYGNINRSALADVLIRAYAEDSGISVASAGFHREAGRSADPVMIDIAAGLGANLNDMRSTTVSNVMLHSSDAIFVMEKSHYDRLTAMDARLSGRVFLLGAHQSAEKFGPEIEDPYGKSEESYLVCYERIAEEVDTLKALIAVRTFD